MDGTEHRQVGTNGAAARHPVTVLVDVTNTVSVNFTSGLQRMVREIAAGLSGPAGEGLDVVPVAQPSESGPLRRLSPTEADRLSIHPPGGPAGRRADAFGFLSPVVRHIVELDVTARLRARRARRKRNRSIDPDLAALEVTPTAGSVFFDIEASWQNPNPRTELLPGLVSEGVRPAVMIADVMPELFPDWFDARLRRLFRAWLMAHLRHSELFLTISKCTASDLETVARRLGFDRDLDIRVVPLGADFPVETARPVALPSEIGRFVLVVGTLEPRKNQRLVLDAFDVLADKHPDLGLVLVGREGWLVGDLVGRIRRHREFNHRLAVVRRNRRRATRMAVPERLPVGVPVPVRRPRRHGHGGVAPRLPHHQLDTRRAARRRGWASPRTSIPTTSTA